MRGADPGWGGGQAARDTNSTHPRAKGTGEAEWGQGPSLPASQNAPECLHLHHQGKKEKREVHSIGDTLQRPHSRSRQSWVGMPAPSAWPRASPLHHPYYHY